MEHGPADNRGYDRIFDCVLRYLWISVVAEMVNSQTRRRWKNINIRGNNKTVLRCIKKVTVETSYPYTLMVRHVR